ncbi:MAG: hypothetical protein ABIK28_00530 [Planctomycetota bacterium]
MKTFRIVLSLILTLLVVFSSYYFGPNRRYKVESRCQEFTLSHKAPRGYDGEGAAELKLHAKLCKCSESDMEVALIGRVKGATEWERHAPVRVEPGDLPDDRIYTFEVPAKPWTTRYNYTFEGRLSKDADTHEPRVTLTRENGEPMMIKFKGAVPAWILVTHILAMFGGFFVLILSVFHSFALALNRGRLDAPGRLAWLAWVIMFIGGVPLGWAMNYFAFHVYWEAWPFGGDVTDNKTQVALIIWGLAAFLLARKPSPKTGILGVLAGLVVLAIFLIPHSL